MFLFALLVIQYLGKFPEYEQLSADDYDDYDDVARPKSNNLQVVGGYLSLGEFPPHQRPYGVLLT